MSISRTDILNRLAERFGYTSYLEIGVAGGATFKNISIREKIGVDPKWRLWYLLDPRVKKISSNRFFARNRRRFDLIFIDGLHVAEQTYRDIQGALAALQPGGTILIHDCMPEDEKQQQVPRVQVSWTGDVWRAFLKASQDPELNTLIFDTNRGCGMVRREPRPASSPEPPPDVDPLDPAALSWQAYADDRHRWLRILPPEEIYAEIDRMAAAS